MQTLKHELPKDKWIDFLAENRELQKLKHEVSIEEKKQERQRLREELTYYPSDDEFDTSIEQLRGLPDKETKAGGELSPAAKAMQKQRELREWKKTQREKEPNSGKRSLETNRTIADKKVHKKKKANKGKGDQKGSGESEIEDKKVESEQESMETESI